MWDLHAYVWRCFQMGWVFKNFFFQLAVALRKDYFPLIEFLLMLGSVRRGKSLNTKENIANFFTVFWFLIFLSIPCTHCDNTSLCFLHSLSLCFFHTCGYCNMLLLPMKGCRLEIHYTLRNFSYLNKLFIFKMYSWHCNSDNIWTINMNQAIFPHQFSLKWVGKLNNDVGSQVFSLECYFSNRKDS